MSSRERSPRTVAAIAGVVVLIVAMIGGAVWVDQSKKDVSQAGPVVSVADLEAEEQLPPLTLPRPGDKAIFFGDSWTTGYSAAPNTLGFTYLVGRELGTASDMQGGSSTGYNAVGVTNLGTYRQRLEKRPDDPDVKFVLFQGALNDLNLPANLGNNARDTFLLAKEKYPNADIVVIGPAPAEIGSYDVVQVMSGNIGWAAHQAGVYFLSPTVRGWISKDNLEDIIDPETKHPHTEGHAALAKGLMAGLKELAADGQSAKNGY
ncbi:SGNH/GDSL hydrolase family protein [Williamsia muralis]|uniref:SGNH/GDSL hydrolase family protein n=1 Tax=Williamsia marianensis TaxID=85044 RepID=UPI003F148E34